MSESDEAMARRLQEEYETEEAPEKEETDEDLARPSAELLFELTGDFDLVSDPIVFVSMSSIRNGL